MFPYLTTQPRVGARIALACVVLSLAPPATAQEPAAPAPPAQLGPTPAPTPAPLVATPPALRVDAEPAPRPLKKKPLFWVTLFGGLALVATGVTLGVILGAVERDPVATIGIGIGN